MEKPKIESFVVSNYFDSGWSGSIVYKMGQNELRVKMPPCLAEALARQVIAKHKWIMNDKANPK